MIYNNNNTNNIVNGNTPNIYVFIFVHPATGFIIIILFVWIAHTQYTYFDGLQQY